MTTRQTALRHVAHANLRLLSFDDESLADAAAYLCRALAAVESLRFPHEDTVAELLGKALKEPKP